MEKQNMPVLVIDRNGEVLLRRNSTRDFEKMDMYIQPYEAETLAVDIVHHLSNTLGAEALDNLLQKLICAAQATPS